MRKKMPNAILGYLVGIIDENSLLNSIIKDSLILKCFSIGFNVKLINRNIVKICKEKNLKVTA